MGLPNHEEKVWQDLVAFVCAKVTALTGNVFGERQRPMVEARLKRHLREIKVSPESYPLYWKTHQEVEEKALIALLTTHFTSFFREFLHFEWLAENLPALVAAVKSQGRTEFKIWSAACSKGQEVWSLAMWMQSYMPKIDPTMKWSIHGTDIDSASVKEASNGVYHRRELESTARHLWEPYWQRGTGEISDWYKIKKALRDHCTFSSANLLALPMNATPTYDVIFCRNVLIYFDKDGQEKAVSGMLKQLQPHGALISGVSESLAGMGLGLKSQAASVYTLANFKPKISTPSVQTSVVQKIVLPKPLKVLCIDDSPTVLSILKKILSHSDFEVVGTATNGSEGQEKIAALRPDVITLDLHMPVMDGFTLIKQTDVARKYPVIVVSTVERQNAAMVHPLFDAGVCDFLEKPSFENLQQIGDELRQKLKMSWIAKQRGISSKSMEGIPALSRTRQSGRVIINAGIADRDSVRAAIKMGAWKNDEVIVQLSGEDHLWEDWAKSLLQEFSGSNIRVRNKFDWSKDHKTSVLLHYSGGSVNGFHHALDQNCIAILEEGDWPSEIKRQAQDMFPATSFVYMTEKFLEGK